MNDGSHSQARHTGASRNAHTNLLLEEREEQQELCEVNSVSPDTTHMSAADSWCVCVCVGDLLGVFTLTTVES